MWLWWMLDVGFFIWDVGCGGWLLVILLVGGDCWGWIGVETLHIVYYISA